MKKIKLQRTHRFAVLAVLLLVCIIVIVMTVTSFQSQHQDKEVVTIYSYSHQGIFDFTIYLKNSTVYDTSVIKPNTEYIFTKTVESIDASFDYFFQGSTPQNISGRYDLSISLKTDYWEKSYPVVTNNQFHFSQHSSGFNTTFPVNLSFYDSVQDEIFEDIGFRAKNPTLIFTCDVFLSIDTTEGFVYDSFHPSLTLSFDDVLMMFNGSFLQEKEKKIRSEIDENSTSNINSQSTLIISSLFFISLLVLVGLGTEAVHDDTKSVESVVMKIKKQYGQWIIEIDKLPRSIKYTERIQVRSIEDLNKISEEMGKPILYHTSVENGKLIHLFLVVDNDSIYEFCLKS